RGGRLRVAGAAVRPADPLRPGRHHLPRRHHRHLHGGEPRLPGLLPAGGAGRVQPLPPRGGPDPGDRRVPAGVPHRGRHPGVRLHQRPALSDQPGRPGRRHLVLDRPGLPGGAGDQAARAAARDRQGVHGGTCRGGGAPLTRRSAMDVLTYRPDPAEFAWTFGGVPPVRRVRPGSILELWTEDAFGGRVRGPDDLVPRGVGFPFVTPQTGPFHVEGAEPGDTLAIHFVSIEPSRDWAASPTTPLFGSLTGTHATALLTEPLPEVVWMYEVDRARRTVTFHARRGDLAVELPLEPIDRKRQRR